LAATPSKRLRELVADQRTRLSRYEIAFMNRSDRRIHAAPIHKEILTR
jgi:hypothetical protein